MPAQTLFRHTGLPDTPNQGIPHAGEGGYDYPPGPYGRTGKQGTTPASGYQRKQGKRNVRKPQLTPEGAQREWENLPAKVPGTVVPSYVGGRPQFVPDDERGYPPRQAESNPSLPPFSAGRQIQPPARRKKLTTGPEQRMTPVIGAYTGDRPFATLRNTVARRVYAIPYEERQYRASPNPGKTGAHLMGRAYDHPDTAVYGEPDGKPIYGMTPNPGLDQWSVTVQSRYFSDQGGMEGYAMNREMLFAKGGTPAPYPPGYKGDEHIRGGRYTGQRYFGSIADQQRIGLPSDSYGIARRRGPNHRPVRFEQPEPWAANYYDLPPDEGTQSPDMIHRAPAARGRSSGKARRGGH